MAYAHVDPSGGTDSTGRGSVASPYASIQYAHDDRANWADGAWDSAGSNTIYLWNTAADVLTSTLNLTMNTLESPLVISGYDGGGSLTADIGFGRSVMCGEIDGNDAVASIFSNEAYITLRNLKLHSTTLYVAWIGIGGLVADCEIYNGSNRCLWMTNGMVVNCNVTSDIYTAGQYSVYMQVGMILDSVVKGGSVGVFAGGQGSFVNRVLVHDVRTVGIDIVGDNAQVRGCTVDGDGADASAVGIRNSGTTTEGASVLDNLITNWDGGTSVGLISQAGAPWAEVGNNFFYNNTTDESYSATPHQAAPDVTLGSDPYESLAGDDYRLSTGCVAIDAAVFGNPDPANPFNAGAWQDLTCTGGGGGETVSVSIT